MFQSERCVVKIIDWIFCALIDLFWGAIVIGLILAWIGAIFLSASIFVISMFVALSGGGIASVAAFVLSAICVHVLTR